jgi:putative ABC transport system permease protein
LGASANSIVAILSGDFLKLILVACFIAVPVAWYAMHAWLQNFAYRIHLSWRLFITSALLVLLIALITISFQSVKAAMANPVKSLRTE